MNSGCRTGLSSDDRLAISTDINGEDVVAVALLFDRVLVLALHGGLLAAVELLLACLGVHDNTKCCDHVDGLALRCVPPDYYTAKLVRDMVLTGFVGNQMLGSHIRAR